MYGGFLSSFAFLAVSVLIGLLCCFWGNRAFKIVLGIVGFAAGAYFGAIVAAHYTGGFGVIAIIAGVIGGLIGGSLIVAVYYAGVFVLGALGGWVIYTMITGAAGYGPHTILLILLVLLGGILALFFQKLIIIVSTAFLGSWLIVSGGFSLLGSGLGPLDLFYYPERLLRPVGGLNTIIVICWVALGIAGSIFQFRFSECPEGSTAPKPEV
ncbi:MAG: DUF4203 domain-containing protein [Candidatus Krumholzibacteria bacterium]|nr:DUF4203 domain-containing protein [Candidatus Krumholzibacteria bacterium]